MYEHIWNGKELIQRFYGQTSVEEIKQSVTEVENDPRFAQITDVFDVFLDCEGITIDEDHFEKTIEEIAEKDFYAWLSNPKVRGAVISDRPEIIRIVDAYIESGISHYPVQRFSSYEEARNWFAEGP